MATKSALLASLMALVLAVPAALAASSDGSFDEQAQAVHEGMQIKQDAGVFGRPGDVPGEDGPRKSAVGDRDLDRYVQRLGFEIRMRNSVAERDPTGFN